jgi:hypothetical protein
MRKLLLATAASLAAITLAAPVPAEAQSRAGTSFSVSTGQSFVGDFRGDRRDRRRDRDGDVFIGEWPQQGDTAWRPESFNDWWHDNPSRAFPRWVQTGNCDRVWWSGGGWRC